MKKYIKLYALLAMALFVGSCEDELDFGRDNNKGTTPATIVSGGEIVFGASAAKKSTRTIYGNPFDSNSNDNDSKLDKIELKWVVDDCVQIASPQSVGMAGGVAEYKVTGVANSTSDNHPSTATLERTGAAGLQWGNVTDGTPYDFYAVYPSVNQLKKSIPASVADTCGLTADGKLKGYLPNTQTVTRSDKTVRDYVFEPNMDYAYMVAKEAYKIPKLDADGNPEDKDADGNPIDASIDLNFSSVVTALKFTIKPGEIGLTNEDEGISTIKVTDLTLYSKSGAELCGAFKCDFSKDRPTFETNNAYSGFSQVAMKLGEDGCTLSSESGSITTTFFLLPIEGGYTKGDLMLRIHYYVGDAPQYMTARLGVDIPVSQMTYINNLKLKDLNGEVLGSAWFSALHPNIYVSQVSIPVAANTFANSSYGVTDDKRTQQTLKIEDMWDMGVRGFEMVNTSDGKATTTTTVNPLGDMVASEKTQSAAGTFVNNVKLLRSKQLASFTYDKGVMVSGDPLILICTYSATDDGYSPARYIQNLFASLDALKGSTYTANGVETDLQITENTFVQLTSNSTVKDVMGKICVIVRPGDDERWAVQGTGEKDESQWDPYALYSKSNITPPTSDYSKYGLTKALPSLITSGWWNKILLISDWGMDSWDSWHRRFDKDGFYYYATTATNYDKITNKEGRTIVSKHKYEEQLLGGAAPEGAPTERKYYYPHDLSNGNENTAYVQDMVRIVKEETFTSTKTTTVGSLPSKKYEHTVNWPGSLTEKKKAIDGLFTKSVETKGGSKTNDIYINNLSGYFITDKHAVSWYPAYYLIVKGGLFDAVSAEVFPGNSKGGDYATCANTLTKYVYDILSGTSNLTASTTNTGSTTKLAEGPWGLVMMDYIGEATNSKDLVHLIMMNNFRFPLAQKPVVQGASVQRIPLSDESVDINKNIMVTWE